MHYRVADRDRMRAAILSGAANAIAPWDGEGEWDRVQAGAAAFVANPTDALWDGPVGNNPAGEVNFDGHVGGNEGKDATSLRYVPPADAVTQVVQAGLYAWIANDRPDAEATAIAAATALTDQVNHGDTQFGDTARWSRFTSDDLDQAPSWPISAWMTKWLNVYDLLTAYEAENGSQLFSPAERIEIVAWMRSYAEWVIPQDAATFDTFYSDRASYTTNAQAEVQPGHAHPRYQTAAGVDTPIPGNLAIKSNNRTMNSLRFVGMLGVFLNDARLIEVMCRAIREYLRSAVYVDGTVAEFERNRGTDYPAQGVKYALELLASLVNFAYALHIYRGDDQCFREETVDGLGLTTDGVTVKSLHYAIINVLRHLTLYYERYVNASKAGGVAGNPAHRIYYGSTEPTNEYKDQHLAPYCRYLLDIGHPDAAWVQSVILRTHPDVAPQPTHPRSGWEHPGNGEWGVNGSVLFPYLAEAA